MEFFNNKKNENLKFKINSEGIDVKNIKPRLIFETENKENYIFYGKVENNVCTFKVPELQLYEKGLNGKVNFEIISEDLYFPVWSEEFEIKTKVNITLEKLVEETIQTEKKPTILSERIVETKEESIKETKEPKVEEPKEPSATLKEPKEKKETPNVTKVEPKEVKETAKIKNFEDFLK